MGETRISQIVSEVCDAITWVLRSCTRTSSTPEEWKVSTLFVLYKWTFGAPVRPLWAYVCSVEPISFDIFVNSTDVNNTNFQYHKLFKLTEQTVDSTASKIRKNCNSVYIPTSTKSIDKFKKKTYTYIYI